MTDLDVHEMWAQLTTSHQHRQPYTEQTSTGLRQGHHVTTVPALVLQLVGATPAGSTDMAGMKPESRPAARVEALDMIALIDRQTSGWIGRLGGVVPSAVIDPENLLTRPGSGTVLRLQRLHGMHRSTTTCGRVGNHRQDEEKLYCCDRGELEGSVRSWWHQARIITGWDMRAWRPDENSCPVCDHRGGLRIRLDGAICVECHTVWDDSQLGLLAGHIRAENHEDDEETSEEGTRTPACA